MRHLVSLAIVGLTSIFLVHSDSDSRRFSTGTVHFAAGDVGCAQQGVGGDPWLNALKNRDATPPNVTPAPITISSILAMHPQYAEAAGKELRKKWSPAAQADVAPVENRFVVVEGYMLLARDEGKEACNCGDTVHFDTHTWLGAKATDPRSTASVVAEISPRLKKIHPHWNQAGFHALIAAHVKLRITGWMMWDQEHPDQVGKSRGTCWEVHPVHRIQALSADGTWKDL
jgi:hypothetical protein